MLRPGDRKAGRIRKKNKKKLAWDAYRDRTDPHRTSAWDAAESRPKDITTDPVIEDPITEI